MIAKRSVKGRALSAKTKLARKVNSDGNHLSPSPDISDPNPMSAKRFVSEGKKLRKEWLKGEGKFTDALYETPWDAMVRKLYRLIGKVVNQHRTDIFAQLIAEMEQRTAGRNSIADKPFNQGVFIILGERDKNGEAFVARDRRSLLAAAMRYAHQHNVVARHFNGFAKQAGWKKIPRKLREGRREPGFPVKTTAAKVRPSGKK